jgi:GT2 family glycosyltransferase
LIDDGPRHLLLRREAFAYRPPQALSSLSVVMPARNEALNIEAAILDALEAASTVTNDYEVVVVDDGSADETASIVRRLAAELGSSVRLIQHEVGLGYGPTVRRAWAEARKQWILFTDADCQFDMMDVQLLIPLADNADIVTGYRADRKDPRLRRFNAILFNVGARRVFGTRVRDVDCAFKLMRRTAIARLDLRSKSAMVNTELLYRARQQDLRIAERSVSHRPRMYGEASGGSRSVIVRAIKEFVTLRIQFNREHSSALHVHLWVLATLSLLAGSGATGWAFAHHVILAYGDAEAHLNISKRVVSGLTPGLAQLGSVWVPLPHLLMAPFATNNWLWRTGLAGAAVSVPSLVLTTVMSYRLAHLLTGNLWAAWLAPLSLLANPNILYLSATPMTEMLLLAMVASSVFYLARWAMAGEIKDLALTALFGALATLSRYDGWALVALELVGVGVISWRRTGWKSIEGTAILFAVLGFSGIASWLLWNQLIFHNPLYFTSSVYGSAQQQKFFLQNGLLPTYNSWRASVQYWFEDVRIIAGSSLMILASIGLVLLLAMARRRRQIAPVVVAICLLSCFGFYIVSLYIGQASLILPRFAGPHARYTMSNLRYGVQALLPLGIFISFLGARRRWLPVVLAAIIMAQGIIAVSTNRVMAYRDGTGGLSSQKVSKGPDSPLAEAWMRSHYTGGLVLMDDYRRPIGPVESGVPMDDFIGSGNKPFWDESLNDPSKYATWVVVEETSTDAVWKTFTPQSKAILEDHFVEVFQAGDVHILERRPDISGYISKVGEHLALNGRGVDLVGVNSYDLLQLPDIELTARVDDIAHAGFNSVRTWCFDRDGGVSGETLSKLSILLGQARVDHVYVTCTLGNALNDYGGLSRFTPTGADFYTSKQAIRAYEAQITEVLHFREPSGRLIQDDPAIAAWDLLNEPRPGSTTAVGGVETWTASVATYVDQLDQRHLVTVGGEGFDNSYPTDRSLAARPGAEFLTLCSAPGITLCSAHLYPKYVDGQVDKVGQVVQEWRHQADSLNKPVILEEVGYSLSDGSAAGRQAFFAATAQAVDQSDVDGGLLWGLGARADSAFTLSFSDAPSLQTLQSWSSVLRRP